MRLAEALIQRAGHQKRIEALKPRLNRNAKVQEGERPGEDPEALLAELEAVAAELLRLIQRINATNSATILADGRTISDAIAVRDVLRIRHGVYRDLATAASITQDRSTKSEVKFLSTVDIAEIQKRADVLAKEHRELDATIQEANWRTDLIEP